MANRQKKRNEIDEKYKWDLSPLCKSEEEFLSALKAMEDYIACLEIRAVIEGIELPKNIEV